MPKYVCKTNGKLKARKTAVKTAAKAKRKLKQLRAAKPQQSVEDIVGKVEECVDSCQPEQALRWCERAQQLYPDNLQVLEIMGPLLLDMGHTDRAIDCLKGAVKLSPGQGHSKYMYLGQLTEGEEAVGYFTKGIEIMTAAVKGGGCASVRGEVTVEGGGCVSVGGEVTVEDVSTAYCALAEVYLTDSCFVSDAEQRCYECCTKAVELAPDNPEAYQLMASCLLSKNNEQEARTMLLKGVALWLPSYRQGNKEEGREMEGWEEEKEEKGGKKEGASASVLTPASMGEEEVVPPYSSRISCAKLLLELGEYDKAFEVLEGLLCEDDEVVGVWYLMGWLHYITADRDSALFYLKQTEKLFTKLECDEEETLAHTRELLAELNSGDGREDKECQQEMDVT